MQILIAEVTDDLKLSRKRLVEKIKELNHDISINYGIPPPSTFIEHNRTYEPALTNSSVYIHILSSYEGKYFLDNDKLPTEDKLPIIAYQAKRGLKAPGVKYKVFWVPKEIDPDQIEDEVYREFLEKHLQGIEDPNYILIMGDPQTLGEDVINSIFGIVHHKEREGLLIVFHPKDEAYALRIKDYAEKSELRVEFASSSNNPNENLSILADQLSRVQKVIVVAGKVNIEWAKERTKHTLKAIINQDLPVSSICTYLAPSATETLGINNGFLSLLTIDQRGYDDFMAQDFNEFFAS